MQWAAASIHWLLSPSTDMSVHKPERQSGWPGHDPAVQWTLYSWSVLTGLHWSWGKKRGKWLEKWAEMCDESCEPADVVMSNMTGRWRYNTKSLLRTVNCWKVFLIQKKFNYWHLHSFKYSTLVHYTLMWNVKSHTQNWWVIGGNMYWSWLCQLWQHCSHFDQYDHVELFC